jgi:porin
VNIASTIGLSWGKAAESTLRNQFTSELFYRFQLTQFLAITPDVQLIVDPELNPTVDVLGSVGKLVFADF